MNWLSIAAICTFFIIPTSAVFECSGSETTAFIRISRARLDGTPVVISTAGHDLTCAQYCRNNIEPTTGAQRVCASFNFDGRETCYFFDDAAAPAGTGELNEAPSANNFYYEKVCLPAVSAHEACTYRSFSFERTRNTQLEGFVKKSTQVSSREECLSTCLKETEFVCRSVNYNYENFMCELSTEDRRSKPQNMRMSNAPVDYYDNNCLNRQNRCGESGGNLIFIKTTQFEIHYYDHTQSMEAQESFCLQKCLDSLNTFCRSVEYSPSEKNCIVSDEDTYSRADQQGEVANKDYYEPVCVAADLSSSTCRQQAAFERFIGSAIEGNPVATTQQVTISDCISLCFQNLNCKSINYDRTHSTCYIYAVGRQESNIKNDANFDYYEFNCESQFGGMALCTNEGIRFIVNTKEPYTGAIYAAEKFSTCSQVVENAKQISITFPPPTISTDCGTTIKDGKMEALVVVSLDGVLPHQVTTEWDRFYRVSCDVSMDNMVKEGSVVVTTMYESGEANTQVLETGTPPPVTATISFLDANDQPVTKASIGDQINLVVSSEQAGPHNMMLTDCTATRVGGEGDAVPFTIIDNGCPRYPALVGPVLQDFNKNRLKSEMKAFRLDGSYDIQIECSVMFCAGPMGCPPSNCLDSGTNELFASHGRKKRSVIDYNNSTTSAETLSAIIRVLAAGEEELEVEEFYRNDTNFKYDSDENISAHNLFCMSEMWFVSGIVSMSMICLLLSVLIVIWGCHSLNQSSKLPM
ncbi:No mechanoreceptor potential A [Strongyloides ratti]|uniref:No mechanoreceptor potential A n=1 Tax=Strongyloides ratti TaxID=34506 RepID=A0A090KR99_STRRB|nr:No mechanoreceptor potential A [Strongyloides ratti]CEF59904.1 No mechanoreceptor potential A [Strongyloides ratti]